ncbi:MAG: FAD-linked oxidase C-terminal domain-containing protein [Vicinamibacterales bacterium]
MAEGSFASLVAPLSAIVGAAHVRIDDGARSAYGVDAMGKGSPADIVVFPADTAQIAAIASLCHRDRVPLVVRGAGTGYSGGAVPTRGGVVLSMERLNRILEIDPDNLLVVVEPHVITGDLQRAVEAVGLFYPPDPASLETCSIGGNVAECAGGPRAFKYGTTKRYVLALEAVLPTGEVIHTGSKAVKNVVGYDLTQLLVGSEGTLAIITRITLRLIPLPPATATALAMFGSIRGAVDAVSALITARVVPVALELIDRDSLEAVQRHTGERLVPDDVQAVLIVETDGSPEGAAEEMARTIDACRSAGASNVSRAATAAERDRIWGLRRAVSLALKATGLARVNHDVVVPRGRVPQLFAVVADLKRAYGLRLASFGHAGDGNIHVNIMFDGASADERARAVAAERTLFERVVALEGSISGEHGIGFAKKAHIGLELSADEIALMRRLKAAFDPHGILNPGKIFPD